MRRLSKNYLTFEGDNGVSASGGNAARSHYLGKMGEQLAAKYLTNKGYHLISQNFRLPGGEIDLIFEKDGIIVFVEVKLRSNELFGTGEEAVTYFKKRTLLRAARLYLQKNGLRRPWRIDLVTLSFVAPRRAQVRHYQNIFEE
jgi:putative endonuclease